MKKNVLKKFAAAALAAATVMSSMSVMAFADDTGSTAKTGSVMITKYMGATEAGDTLSPENYTGAAPTEEEKNLLQGVEFAYVEVGERVQVDTAGEKSSQTEIQYNVTNADFLQAIGIKTGVDKNYKQSELNNKVSDSANKTAVINFVKKNKESNVKVTDKSGTASFTGLDLNALYVFAETDATKAVLASDGKTKVNVTKVSVPFLVSLPFTEKDGETVTDLKVYPKNSTGNENIDKEIESVGTTPITGKQANANIGDIITYKVTYSVPVPENGLADLQIVDTMSEGLTFTNDKDNIKVVDDEYQKTTTSKQLDYGKDYDVTQKGKEVTINFKKYLKSLEKNSTEKFTITYKVKLNDKAVLGQDGNKNSVKLQYKNDINDEFKDVPGNDTTVFTYGIDLLKKGEGTDTVLKGVKFKLTDGNDNAVNVEKKGKNTFYTPGENSNEVETGADGRIYIRGLKPGTYKLKETKTNAGYVLLKNPVVIEITQNDATTGDAKAIVGEGADKKDDVTMNPDQNNTTSATAKVPLTVVNSKGFDLPATGGRGIALFTIAGIAIVAAAGSLLFMRKRSK